jgi:hypothetical protein
MESESVTEDGARSRNVRAGWRALARAPVPKSRSPQVAVGLSTVSGASIATGQARRRSCEPGAAGAPQPGIEVAKLARIRAASLTVGDQRAPRLHASRRSRRLFTAAYGPAVAKSRGPGLRMNDSSGAPNPSPGPDATGGRARKTNFFAGPAGPPARGGQQITPAEARPTKRWSKRGSVKGKAVVTKRLKPLKIDGRTVHSVGMPLNFGFIGEAKKASPINSLTPPVGDANAQTPEYKAFLVDIEPISGPVA